MKNTYTLKWQYDYISLLKSAGAASGCTDLINDGLSLCFCMCTLTETKAVVED